MRKQLEPRPQRPELAESDKFQNGRDHSAIGREGMHTGHSKPGCPLPSRQRTQCAPLHTRPIFSKPTPCRHTACSEPEVRRSENRSVAATSLRMRFGSTDVAFLRFEVPQ